MTLYEAKEQFIQTWGTLGTSWGINRTMAQIHALLLISPEALSTEEIMEKLNISRGNTNMNTRELIAWGLVYKELKSGDRKEYFIAHKDIWHVATSIIRERKKREIDPLKRAIEQLTHLQGEKNNPEAEAYLEVVKEIQDLVGGGEKIMQRIVDSDKNWFFKKFLKLFT